MSGAGAGSGIGLGGMLPELPHDDPADRPQQWSEALRDVTVVKVDNVTTAAVALDVNAPALVGAALPRPGIVPEQMAAEGLEEHPVGLTEPTPSIDRMAPVEASVAGQDAGPGDLRSPLMPSAALQFGALPRVANQGGAGLAGSTETPATSVWASASPAADAASMRLAFPAAGLDSQAAVAGLASAFLAGAPRSLPAPGLTPASGHSAGVERNGLSGPAQTRVASVGRGSNEVMPAGLAPFGRTAGGTAQTGGVPIERPADGTTQTGGVPVGRPAGGTAQTGGLPVERVAGGTAQTGGVPVARSAGGSAQTDGVPVGRSAAGTAQTGGAPVGRSAAGTAQTDGAPVGRLAGGTTQTGGAPVERAAGGTVQTGGAPVERAASGTAQTGGAPVKRAASGTAQTSGLPVGRPAGGTGQTGGAPVGRPADGTAQVGGAPAAGGTAGTKVAPVERQAGGTAHAGVVTVGRAAGGTAESKVAPVEPGSSEAAQTLTREGGSTLVDRGGVAAMPDAGRTDAAAANAPLVGGASHHAGTPGQATMPGVGPVAGGLAAATAIALPGQIPGLGRAVLLRHGASSTTGAPQVVSYSERRAVPIDLAPVSAEVPAWRLDDTQTLVTVGPEGPSAAALDAAELYHSLMERGGGLAAIQPGQGFASWEGSPLWLSLAGIPKPARMGVLAASAPGRVQVMRTEHGEWLVEHAGGPWPAPIALRHDATAGDDQSLLLDVLYGIGSAPPETPALQRFEAATTMLRFARGATGPAGWRSQEAWAMVARCCAVAAVQPGQDALPQAEAALARAMQATVSAVMDGLAPAVDPLAIAPLDRDRFVAVVRSGDPVRLAAGLRGLGHATLAQLRQGKADGVGPIELLALAACLGRLTREAASFPSPHREVPRFPAKQPEATQLALHPRLRAAETMIPWRRQ